MKKRYLALVAALALAVGGVVGGTLAWLTAETAPVVNTFTPSDINITLTETPGQTYKMIPGWTITKDPTVTVKKDSVDCYLFVKLEKSTNFDQFMEYSVDTEVWKELPNATEDANSVVYYRIVNENTSDQDFQVIKDNTVKVKDTVTKQDMGALAQDSKPSLTVTAYASQLYKNENKQTFTADEAWENISTLTP